LSPAQATTISSDIAVASKISALSAAPLKNHHPLNWIPQTSGTNVTLTGAAYGNNQYVVTSSDGLVIMSTDDKNWIQIKNGEKHFRDNI
jgi:hypothetical protein